MKILALLLLIGFTTPEIETSDVQKIKVSGVVIEASTGDPIPGATIKIESLNREVFTDFDGNFSIENVLPGKYTVEVSFVSFESKELSNIELTSSAGQLQIGLK